jgi:hypothetical protein
VRFESARCEPGAVCSIGFAGGSFCARYCDALEPTSAKSCDALCPSLYSVDDVNDDADDVGFAGAHCFGGIGDTCTPLAPSCNGEQSCFGYDPPLVSDRRHDACQHRVRADRQHVRFRRYLRWDRGLG